MFLLSLNEQGFFSLTIPVACGHDDLALFLEQEECPMFVCQCAESICLQFVQGIMQTDKLLQATLDCSPGSQHSSTPIWPMLAPLSPPSS
eukprot:scaffold93452_cov19-Tisochrysis_lutea.AAC.2